MSFVKDDENERELSVECLKGIETQHFNIIDKRIKFCSQDTNFLTPKPKCSFRRLKHGIQEFHGKNVLVRPDKAATLVKGLSNLKPFRIKIILKRIFLQDETKII